MQLAPLDQSRCCRHGPCAWSGKTWAWALHVTAHGIALACTLTCDRHTCGLGVRLVHMVLQPRCSVSAWHGVHGIVMHVHLHPRHGMHAHETCWGRARKHTEGAGGSTPVGPAQGPSCARSLVGFSAWLWAGRVRTQHTSAVQHVARSSVARARALYTLSCMQV